MLCWAIHNRLLHSISAGYEGWYIWARLSYPQCDLGTVSTSSFCILLTKNCSDDLPGKTKPSWALMKTKSRKMKMQTNLRHQPRNAREPLLKAALPRVMISGQGLTAGSRRRLIHGVLTSAELIGKRMSIWFILGFTYRVLRLATLKNQWASTTKDKIPQRDRNRLRGSSPLPTSPLLQPPCQHMFQLMV